MTCPTYFGNREQTKEKAKKTRNRKIKRYALIGLASVGGGAIIGKCSAFDKDNQSA